MWPPTDALYRIVRLTLRSGRRWKGELIGLSIMPVHNGAIRRQVMVLGHVTGLEGAEFDYRRPVSNHARGEQDAPRSMSGRVRSATRQSWFPLSLGK